LLLLAELFLEFSQLNWLFKHAFNEQLRSEYLQHCIQLKQDIVSHKICNVNRPTHFFVLQQSFKKNKINKYLSHNLANKVIVVCWYAAKIFTFLIKFSSYAFQFRSSYPTSKHPISFVSFLGISIRGTNISSGSIFLKSFCRSSWYGKELSNSTLWFALIN